MNKNIYIFAGESYMVRESVKSLENSLNITFPEMNITEYKTTPRADELIEACCSVPFMSDMRLVVVNDCALLTSKRGAKDAESKEEEPKKDDKSSKAFVEAIGRIPATTALVLITDGALDKRKAIYSLVSKQGTIKEFPAPGQAECIRFAQDKAKELGASISAKAASLLVEAVGCDYYAIDNEIAKLCVYGSFEEITAKHVAECASKSLEYNVFEIHGLLINKQGNKAKHLLEDILRTERPEGLIGLLARKIRDMYKVKTMADLKYPASRISEATGIKSFVVDILKKECARFTQQDLRDAQVALADLDYGIKSGEADASLALPEALFRIYKL